MLQSNQGAPDPSLVTPAELTLLIDGVSTLIALETQFITRGLRAPKSVRLRVCELVRLRQRLYSLPDPGILVGVS